MCVVPALVSLIVSVHGGHSLPVVWMCVFHGGHSLSGVRMCVVFHGGHSLPVVRMCVCVWLMAVIACLLWMCVCMYAGVSGPPVVVVTVCVCVLCDGVCCVCCV